MQFETPLEMTLTCKCALQGGPGGYKFEKTTHSLPTFLHEIPIFCPIKQPLLVMKQYQSKIQVLCWQNKTPIPVAEISISDSTLIG